MLTRINPETGEIELNDDIGRDEVLAAREVQRKALITRDEIDGLAKVDQDFVFISERIREEALKALEGETTIAAMLEGKNRAQAIGEYITRKIIARDAKLEAQNNIAEIRIRYERELGKLIRKLQSDGELVTKETNLRNSRSHSMVDRAITLADVGISYNQSSRWQSMADLPDDKFEKQISDAKENGWELTTAAIVKHGQNHGGGSKPIFEATLPVGQITSHLMRQFDGRKVVRVVVYEIEKSAPADGSR